jgi:hypothetical protein
MELEELRFVIELFLASANVLIAIAMFLNLREIRRDRRREFLKERIESFYLPLINLFGHRGLIKDSEAYNKVEEILVSKRHLCGGKVAKILPLHFTAPPVTVGVGDCFQFANDEEKKRWEEVADTLWSEYVEVLKEYYKLVGIKKYVLPKKPEWKFEVMPRGNF